MSTLRPGGLDVHVDLAGTTVLAGVATFRYRGATTVTEFAYDRGYLARRGSYALDPALQLSQTIFVVEGLPAAFADSTPDWWGRLLVSRKARLEASAGQREQPLLTEPDFLAGVSDLTRQGNVRFAEPATREFVGPDVEVPKLLDLPELLQAADRVTADGDQAEVANALKVLLAAGSGTLGGARPKASVQDDGRLLIAKFPSREDEWDVMAWEKTALDLAELCGIDVPRRRLVRVGARHVLLLERFDRAEAGRRVGYASARTMAEVRSSAGNDYLDLVDAISDHSGSTSEDLRSLWLRIAFTVAVNNTDDHFHNHGFLRTRRGWTLAPAFDINIDPQLARPRTTALEGAATRDESLRKLMRQVDYFGLDEGEARVGMRRIAEALKGWRAVAAANGVPDSELDRVGSILDDYLDNAVW